MKRKGFTLIELIAVLIILAILSLVVVPLVLNIIRNAKNSANKRSIDGYGRAVDLAIANYLVEHLTYPDTFDKLEIEYSGSKVECKTSRINPDETVYLSECKVNGRLVKDNKNIDGYYHYGILKMTNQEYVDTYGKNLEDALKAYHDEHNEYPSDYTTLTLPPLDKEVACDVKINYDGTVYLTNCKVGTEEVLDENNDDGYYHYGEFINAVKYLLKKTNSKSVTNYADGNTHEMYTFEHPATEQTGALIDYRYIGNNPYNYVTFNNELWRIIGVFTVEDENGKQAQRIKIVRNEKLSSNMAWDSNNINEWSSATLNSYLNGEYYNGIDDTSKNMTADTKYYLGGSNTSVGGAETYYTWERGTTVYSGRSKNWAGKIALMYPSDYTYTYALGVDNICYTNGDNCYSSQGAAPTNGWIYTTNSNSFHWLLTSFSDNDSFAFSMTRSGNVGYTGNYVYISVGIRPTLYLSSSVKISSGTGKSDDPYQLSMN